MIGTTRLLYSHLVESARRHSLYITVRSSTLAAGANSAAAALAPFAGF
jgi:hypothetical protein